MGAYLSQPVTAKETVKGDYGKVSYGASAMQGWRTGMEVSAIISLSLFFQGKVVLPEEGEGWWRHLASQKKKKKKKWREIGNTKYGFCWFLLHFLEQSHDFILIFDYDYDSDFDSSSFF